MTQTFILASTYLKANACMAPVENVEVLQQR